MADPESEEFAFFATIPLGALNVSCRSKLSTALNQDMLRPTNDGFLRNWKGLLEVIGYQYDMVTMLRQKDDPTMTLIELWEKETPSPTFAKLLEYLQTIERYDVIEDIMPLLDRDAKSFVNREEAKKRNLETYRPIQDNSISSVASTVQLTRHDVIVPDIVDDSFYKDDRYDAYVSYVDSDIQFVLQLIEKLEKDFGLRLFVKERDLLAGTVEHEADLKMINERCKRILLILSPDFLSNPKCEFQTMFAQALAVDNNLYARKVIPVICKPCQLPVRLKYIAHVDYTKKDFFSTFWERLFSSIKNPMQIEFPVTVTSGSQPIWSSGPVPSEVGLASASSLPPLPTSDDHQNVRDARVASARGNSTYPSTLVPDSESIAMSTTASSDEMSTDMMDLKTSTKKTKIRTNKKKSKFWPSFNATK